MPEALELHLTILLAIIVVIVLYRLYQSAKESKSLNDSLEELRKKDTTTPPDKEE